MHGENDVANIGVVCNSNAAFPLASAIALLYLVSTTRGGENLPYEGMKQRRTRKPSSSWNCVSEEYVSLEAESLTLRLISLIGRQIDKERGSSADLALHLDVSAVLLDNLVDDY